MFGSKPLGYVAGTLIWMLGVAGKHLAAGAQKNGNNGKMAAKWGKMGNCEKLPKIPSENWRKMCEIDWKGEKIGERRDNLGQTPHFFQSHFPHFPTASPPFPHVPLMNFASRSSQLEKWKILD